MTRCAVCNTPRKPKCGDACNGCGVCCIAEPCASAVEFIGATEGPCPALEFEDGRYWCGMVRHPAKYLGEPEKPWADKILGGIYAEMIAVGHGCDADCEPAGGTIKGQGWHCESCLWIADRAACYRLTWDVLRARARN